MKKPQLKSPVATKALTTCYDNRRTEVMAKVNEHIKLSANWEGPYAIREQVYPGAYRLLTLQGKEILWTQYITSVLRGGLLFLLFLLLKDIDLLLKGRDYLNHSHLPVEFRLDRWGEVVGGSKSFQQLGLDLRIDIKKLHGPRELPSQPCPDLLVSHLTTSLGVTQGDSPRTPLKLP
ncbi:hypothetical protein Cgig2_025346 [Carnegiea gigantea]|uniref:Uncharacterized protein n=1 Tax=Carnegiea gigantea TaxID=171969 RepID=A0A9Q1Q6B2_9CARY|nr:hypothetical protein Cgig2_025346 [Carnegiea gigantea]